jgi:hypothetical protein
MGRFWIQSKNTGMQYGFPVDLKPYKMVFGPITSWSRRYWGATTLPAKTQLVRIVANPDLFPTSWISSEPVQLDIHGNPVPSEEEECCGWEDYLKKIDFDNHFTNGNPSQILRKIINTRLHALSAGAATASYEDPIFGADGCEGYVQPKLSPPEPPELPAAVKPLSFSISPPDIGPSDPPPIRAPGTVSLPDIGPSDPPPIRAPEVPQQEDIGQIRVYRDSWFDINTPFSGQEVDFFEGETSALHSNVEFDYNFYAKGYEDMLAKEKIPEAKVPNLYLNIAPDGSVPFILYLRNQSKCRYREFAKLITYIGYKDLLIPIKNISWVKSLDIYSESLPLEAEISFGTDNLTAYANSIEDSKMDAVVLRRLSEGAAKREGGLILGAPYTDSTNNGDSPPLEEISKFFFAKRYYTSTKAGTSVKPIFGKKDIKTIDLYEWLYAQNWPEIPQNIVPFPGPPNINSKEGGDHIFIGPNNPSIAMSLAEGKYKNSLEYMANFLVLSGRVNELTNTYLRSYEQMMLGKTPHSETIAYRIAKFDTAAVAANDALVQAALSEEGIQIESLSDSDSTSAISADGFSALEEGITDAILAGAADGVSVQPIQNIWISNSSNVDIIEYIDTQLLYDKRYTYVVYAYQLAVGTEYFYSKQPITTEPTPCQGKSGITSDIYGPLSDEQALLLLNNMSTSTDYYNTIINFVNEEVIRNLLGAVPTVFDCEGTVVIAALETFEEIVHKLEGEFGGAYYTEYVSTGHKLYIFCYCFDYEIENIGIPGLKILGEYSPPAADTGATKEEQEAACEIYTKMSEYLKYDPELSESDLLTLGAGDYLEPEITETYYTAEECPDVYKYGTDAGSAGGSKSTTYTGWLPGEITKEDPNPASVAVDYTVVKEWEATCECPPPEPCSELFLVTSIPSLKIHEVPYFTWTGRVKDKPPVYPDVEVVPYRAVNNKLLFLLGAGIGDYTAPPIIINQRDKNYFKSVLGAQNMKTGLVNFGFDDPISFFEVYRLTSAPFRYEDFSKGTRRVYTTRLSEYQDTRLDAVSFIEDVEPNQKYYYIFRAIDVHGNVSNPSPIYEIEIADNDGAIYPLVSIYEVSPNLDLDLDKKAQRLVQVKPAFLQSVINEVQSGLEDASSAYESHKNIKLGVRNKKIWNNNFKLRITSCKTRRAIDLNLGFKTKFVEQEVCVEERKLIPSVPPGLSIPDLTPFLPDLCEDIRRVHEGPIVKVPGAGRRPKSTSPGTPEKREGSVAPSPTGGKKSIY